MNVLQSAPGKPVSSLVLSMALILGSIVWLCCAGVGYVTGTIQNDWSAIPLLLMLTLMVTPAVCFSIVLVLLDRRRRLGFSRLDRWALAAACVPVTFGTVLAVWATRIILMSREIG